MARLTTLGVGGAGRYFCRAAGEDDLAEALGWAAARKQPWLALGGGSNLLVAERGYGGLVIQMRVSGLRDLGEGRVEAGAGEAWDRLVAWSVERGLAGIECMSGIPGTVGATPVQNVGAYGQEVADVVESVRAWDSDQCAWVELNAGECGFA
ncbi:MAG TPA: FAD-binding protein, partial [Chloroflexota bacterium]|nr:FAD-binding protein [Chloroflexota bacterium]